MGLRDLNIDLTKEHVALWDSAKKFMRQVWRPAAIELDRMVNPEDVYAEGSVLWDVFRKSNELGYHTMMFPEEQRYTSPLLKGKTLRRREYRNPSMCWSKNSRAWSRSSLSKYTIPILFSDRAMPYLSPIFSNIPMLRL